jgi:Protein of unknown function (DUF3079)
MPLYCRCALHPNAPMSKTFPVKPLHPERVCWGCDRYCAADSLLCGNGSERTQHPAESFGDDWLESGIDAQALRGTAMASSKAPVTASASASSPAT